MNITFIEKVTASIQALSPIHPIGRIEEINGAVAHVSGISQIAGLGDPVSIYAGSRKISGEIIQLGDGIATILVEETMEGIKLNDAVHLHKPIRFAPDESWIGRVIDPNGEPLDGAPILQGKHAVPLRRGPPPAHTRRQMGERLETSLAIFNTFLPLVKGQRIGLFAGSGVGKSTLIADLAQSATADLIVIALIGERGRELVHFIENVLGPEGMARSIIVAATSDRAPQIRRRCALAAMAVAEHFRDQGLHVVLFADSMTRFCEAHREVAIAAGEEASLRGYPASMVPAIASLCERAGPGTKDTGDITAVFSVLVSGSDMEEPVADIMRGILDGHIVMDREIAERGRFPAIDVLKSVSRSLPAAAERHENALISKAREHLGNYKNAELMIQAGLYVKGSDPKVDDAIKSHDALETFLAVRDSRGIKSHFDALNRTMPDSMLNRAVGAGG
ncbi:flagellum-specific ATP synthase [Loktanella ponticola]|uniref:Flagellum-specific ATP synthase n=1 Tax=Yoonia ponticola TaxID=1524255 RepID=A0A7W9BL41_9RHOB|nr:FliI/YscN family ATPase [Yoonia ponticola]MBB5722312.1 flagellum-specific ATP synthase [Yoonia ponticola]